MEISLILAGLVGYALGSIPFGLIFTRMAGLGDIRKVGSGNIGATNVLRTGNKGLAAATLLADAAKAAAAVLIARYVWGDSAALFAGFTAFLGHLYPVWLRFKGGKGVAAMIGALTALAWPVGAIFCAVWIFVAFVRKYSSLAALTAAATAPIFAYQFSGLELASTAAALALLLFYRHLDNIRRLLDGTEPKIGADK